MPPILPNDLLIVNLINAPQFRVSMLVQEDRLEDVFLERHIWRELALVICAVEAHLQLRYILRVHLDQVHGFEVFLRHLDAGGLVDAGQLVNGLFLIVEVFVMLLHVVAVPVRDGDVISEDGGAKDFLFGE